MTTAPEVGSASPARTFMIVDLPQPEWPRIQTNSPFSIPKLAFSKTVSVPPDPSGNCCVSCSIERNGLAMTASLFHISHDTLQRAETGIEDHADNADHEDGEDDRGQVEVVPLVPDVVADPGSTD